MAPTHWEQLFDDLVARGVKYVFSIMKVTTPGVEARSLVRAGKYRMVFFIQNVADEVFFEKVNVRLVQLDSNAPIQFYSDDTYSTAVPRMNLYFTNLGKGQAGSEAVHFVANRNVSSNATLFSIGIYAVATPEGKSWTNAVFLHSPH